MGHSPERFPPRHRPRSSGPGRGPTLALPPPGRRAGAEALGPQGTSRSPPPRAPPGAPRLLRGTAPLRERRQRPRPSSARCAGGLRAKRPAEVAGTNRFARGFEPLGRGAVTGVHETDTLLCATKTCSHVCAASAPASVWFSCFTAHRKNVLAARKMADEKSKLQKLFTIHSKRLQRASQACLPASNVARGRHTLSPPLPPSGDCWPSRRRCPLSHRALMQGHDHSPRKQ